MATFEHLFIKSGTNFDYEARDLAVALGMEVVHNEEGVWLNRSLEANEGVIGGQIYTNNLSDPEPEPSEVQAFDGYDTVFALRVLPRKSADQRKEAKQIFDELVRLRPHVPMLLTHDLDLLVCAYLPGRGVHVFVDEPTVDAADQDQWGTWVAGA